MVVPSRQVLKVPGGSLTLPPALPTLRYTSLALGRMPLPSITLGSLIVSRRPTPFVHAQLVAHLHSIGRALVGVVVKPPDESFCRLETTCPEPSL